MLPYEVGIRIEPTHWVARRSISTVAERMLADSTATIHDLLAELAGAGSSARDPVMCINGAPDANGRIAVHACAGIEDPAPDLPTAEITEIRGGPVAWLSHTGAYEELGLAFHAVFAWIQQHGHEVSGAMRELYLNDPAKTPVDELVTEVMIPVVAYEGGRPSPLG